jgi:hypothetical protein
MEPAIQIDGVAFEISEEGLDALLTRRGVDVKLSALNLQISAEALVALLRRLLPDAAVLARITPEGIVVEREGEGGRLRVDLALPEVRLQAGDGRLELRGG